MKIIVQNDTINFAEKDKVNTGAIDVYNVDFEFSSEWADLTKVAIILQERNSVGIEVPIINNEIVIPFLQNSSYYYVGVVGFTINGEIKTKQISTNLLSFFAGRGAGEITTKENEIPSPDVWEQYLSMVTGLYNDTVEAKNDTEDYKNTVEEYKDTTQGYMNATEGFKNEAEESAEKALASEENAKESEDKAKISEENADESEGITTQAMQDFLNMLGTEVATLIDGKLNPSQIPPLSINDVFEVDSIEEMLELTAERGDTALIMGVDEDNNTIVLDSYILASDDPTDINNWKKLGISYVANAGHSITSDFAEDSNKINGHRLITMTEAQYEQAVVEEETIYLVFPDEV